MVSLHHEVVHHWSHETTTFHALSASILKHSPNMCKTFSFHFVYFSNLCIMYHFLCMHILYLMLLTDTGLCWRSPSHCPLICVDTADHEEALHRRCWQSQIDKAASCYLCQLLLPIHPILRPIINLSQWHHLLDLNLVRVRIDDVRRSLFLLDVIVELDVSTPNSSRPT